jgi:hypothetical protein
MTATRNDIEGWFDKGVSQGYDYMLVMCDSYDCENYPQYCQQSQLHELYHQYPSNMQYVEELYDLHMDKESQIKQRRCFSFPDGFLTSRIPNNDDRYQRRTKITTKELHDWINKQDPAKRVCMFNVRGTDFYGCVMVEFARDVLHLPKEDIHCSYHTFDRYCKYRLEEAIHLAIPGNWNRLKTFADVQETIKEY